MTTKRTVSYLAGLATVVLVAGACSMSTSETAGGTARASMSDPSGNDWTTYHGTYRSWHYSPLTEINADNVKRLRVAWGHPPGRSTRGPQSMPLGARRGPDSP